MSTLFIADLHLEEARPDISALFFKFLEDYAASAKALYILGDLFEVWIGDDDHSPFNQSIIQALRKTRDSGTELYFMPGNRDFLIGRKFAKASGCKILPDEYLFNLYGQPTLLMHGDTLCTEDLAYLKFRRWSRNYFVQQYFLWKSLEKRKALASNGRKLSAEHTRMTAPEIMDVTTAEVERVMLKHQVQHLIHGHTHRPMLHQFNLNHQAATRSVLAPWHEQGSALLYSEHSPSEVIVIK